jgi:copper chaperone CopZ
MTGMRAVSVDVLTKRITVSFEPTLVSRADILEKIDEEGYLATG